MNTRPVSIAIPTYRREQVLLDTVRALLRLDPGAAELLVLDQSELHDSRTQAQLASWESQGVVRWVKLARPSIPAAMNEALRLASHRVVLFVDDDVLPEGALVDEHWQAHAAQPGRLLVAGRVIQPWEEGRPLDTLGPQSFAGTRAATGHGFIGCNFSVDRDAAIAAGGFDENFVRVAYHFEAEFAHRWRAAGHAIRFQPRACLHHLKAGAGGTRSFGDHLATWRPDHAVGAYYFGLRTGGWRMFLLRPWRAVLTRYHLRRPWRILPTLLAELRGMGWALRLHRGGPRYIDRTGGRS